MYQTLGRIEATLEAVHETTRNTREDVKSLTGRVSSLEVSRGWLIGAGAGAGGFMGWLTHLFKG